MSITINRISVKGSVSGNVAEVDASNNLQVTVQTPIPAGTNVIGAVTANAGTNLNTSALALDTSVNGILVSQGSTTSGEKGPLVQGAVTTSAPSYTNGQTSPLSLTPSGALRVDFTSTSTASSRQEPNQQIVNGNAYSTTVVAATVGTTETNSFYLKNGSSKTLYIFNIFMLADSGNGNNWVNFKAYYNPTVTANGTAGSAINLLAGSANATTATIFTASTTSARGNLVKFWTAGSNNAAAPLQDTQFANYFVLPANQSILITATAKANGQAYDGTIMWFEV